MKKKPYFKILSVSDIHLFHDRVSTFDIAVRLMALITEAINTTSDIRYLIIAGDLFDKIRLLYEEDTQDAMNLVAWIMKTCDTFNIKLRLMEGTPSHDRNQPLFVKTLFDVSKYKETLDFRYIDALTFVEEDDGSTWVYVPDELHHDYDVVYEQVVELIKSRGLTKVDYMVTHGIYDIHLGGAPVTNFHIADKYLALVNILIINGHIHTSSIYKSRFLTNGSFDRLRHGEEEQKGLWVIETTPDKNIFHFFHNSNAAKFVTELVEGVGYDIALDMLRKSANFIKKGSIQIAMDTEQHDKGLLRTLVEEFPSIRWTKKETKVNKKNEDAFVFAKTAPPAIIINKGNIVSLIDERLSLAPALREKALSLLPETLNAIH